MTLYPSRQLAPKYSAEETASAQVIALNTFESFKMHRSGVALKIIICCVFSDSKREREREQESELQRRLRTNVWRQRQACIVIRSMSFLCSAEIDLDFAASARRRFEIK